MSVLIPNQAFKNYRRKEDDIEIENNDDSENPFYEEWEIPESYFSNHTPQVTPQVPYKLSHKNHPCAIWARESLSNSGLLRIGAISANLLITVLEAISPPTYPPIPSATARTRDEMKPESSLPSRCRPSSDLHAISEK